MNNSENLIPLPVDNSSNIDILSDNNHLSGSFQDPILSDVNLNSPQPQSTLNSNFNFNFNFNLNLNANSDLENGIFTVDSTGILTIDFLFDAGGYQSELGIFNLTGMENLNPGDDEFIQEAARRALSNSTNGYIAVNDDSEGAKFTGELGEEDRNRGDYAGIKSFSMNPGDNFALMLVPEGKLEDVLNNPAVDNNKRPLFSLSLANPDNAIQMMRLGMDVFGMEDLRLDRNSDSDYNDIIFQVKGARSKAIAFEELDNSAEGYGSTTINAITGIEESLNLPPNLTDSNLAVEGFVSGGSEEGIFLSQTIQNNPSQRKVGFIEVNNPADAQQTWLIIHGWNDSPGGKFNDIAQEIANTKPGDRVLLLDWRA